MWLVGVLVFFLCFFPDITPAELVLTSSVSITWPLLVLRSAVFHPSKLLSSCGFLCLQCSPGFDKLPSPPPIPPATSLCTHQHHFLSGHAVLDFSGQTSSALGFTTPPPWTFLTLTATVTSVWWFYCYLFLSLSRVSGGQEMGLVLLHVQRVVDAQHLVAWWSECVHTNRKSKS